MTLTYLIDLLHTGFAPSRAGHAKSAPAGAAPTGATLSRRELRKAVIEVLG